MHLLRLPQGVLPHQHLRPEDKRHRRQQLAQAHNHRPPKVEHHRQPLEDNRPHLRLVLVRCHRRLLEDKHHHQHLVRVDSARHLQQALAVLLQHHLPRGEPPAPERRPQQQGQG